MVLPLPLMAMLSPRNAPEPGVSSALAEERPRRITNLRYELQFDMPAAASEPLTGRSTIRFTLADAAGPGILDFAPGAGHVRRTTAGGGELRRLERPARRLGARRVSYLHHRLRAPASQKYIRPSLDLLREIQRTGDIFFPKGWMDTTLAGDSSASAARVVMDFLAGLPPDYPDRLRRIVLSSADLLFRASRVANPATGANDGN